MERKQKYWLLNGWSRRRVALGCLMAVALFGGFRFAAGGFSQARQAEQAALWVADWSAQAAGGSESGSPLAGVPRSLAPSQVIRLHVVANSDSPQDQEAKLAIRDRILEEFSPVFAGVQSLAQAESEVRRRLKAVEALADAELLRRGLPYRAKAEYGIHPFPARAYGPFVLEPGKYRAVRVLLGAAAGKNWWCVLFPPACFLNVDSAVAGQRARVVPERDNGRAAGTRHGSRVLPAGTNHQGLDRGMPRKVILSFRLFEPEGGPLRAGTRPAAGVAAARKGTAAEATTKGGGWWNWFLSVLP
ncbi:MAG: stage II sporulation protein R [Firmicutes bacterium]|nr:stage II sporulation protein R [Bacillota bacterium]